MLITGGTLDSRFGGPSMKRGTKTEYGYRFTAQRRSAFVPVFRNTLPEVF